MKLLTCMERREAIERGLTKFYTGRPCIKGHRSERETVTGACIQCKSEYAVRQRIKARETIKAVQRAALEG